MCRITRPVVLALLLSLPACLVAQQPPDSPEPTPEGQEPAEALPEDSDLTVVVGGDRVMRRVRLAFPSAELDPSLTGEARAAAEELEETLRSDLLRTGLFEIHGPQVLSILDLTGRRSHDFEQYRALQNEVVLLTTLKWVADRLVLEGRVYDLENGRSILGKRYKGTPNLARRIAHTFTDEIVFYFTGRPGIATSTIAFVSSRDDPRYKELYLMDYDGHNQRRISGHKSISLSPEWSPSGDGIAYISYFDPPPGIFFVELDTGFKKPIVNDEHHNLTPSFSPDGRRVAFSTTVDRNREIFVVDRDGKNRHRLTSSAGIDTNPAWSPNGREIAFTSSRSGSPQIYLMDAEGTNVRRLTYQGTYNDGAAWHPDGTKIVYSARPERSTRLEIALVDVVTRESRFLTSGGSTNESATFSPDGRWIAFESNRGGNKQIWVMDVNGRNLRQLTRDGQNQAPAWSKPRQ